MQVYQRKDLRSIAGTANGNGQERRSRKRYPLRMPLTYKILRTGRKRMRGQTIDMSSRGLLFTADEPIPARTGVKILVDWPVDSPDRGPLKLELFARTVRSGGNEVAAEILSHHVVVLASEEEGPAGQRMRGALK